jgi:hypothetical protein
MIASGCKGGVEVKVFQDGNVQLNVEQKDFKTLEEAIDAIDFALHFLVTFKRQQKEVLQ